MLFCNQCGTRMKVEKNGVAYVDMDSEGKPYKIYMGDVYQCPSCGQRTTNTNHQPTFESFQEDFQGVMTRFDKKGLLIPPLFTFLRPEAL